MRTLIQNSYGEVSSIGDTSDETDTVRNRTMKRKKLGVKKLYQNLFKSRRSRKNNKTLQQQPDMTIHILGTVGDFMESHPEESDDDMDLFLHQNDDLQCIEQPEEEKEPLVEEQEPMEEEKEPAASGENTPTATEDDNAIVEIDELIAEYDDMVSEFDMLQTEQSAEDVPEDDKAVDVVNESFESEIPARHPEFEMPADGIRHTRSLFDEDDDTMSKKDDDSLFMDLEEDKYESAPPMSPDKECNFSPDKMGKPIISVISDNHEYKEVKEDTVGGQEIAAEDSPPAVDAEQEGDNDVDESVVPELTRGRSFKALSQRFKSILSTKVFARSPSNAPQAHMEGSKLDGAQHISDQGIELRLSLKGNPEMHEVASIQRGDNQWIQVSRNLNAIKPSIELADQESGEQSLYMTGPKLDMAHEIQDQGYEVQRIRRNVHEIHEVASIRKGQGKGMFLSRRIQTILRKKTRKSMRRM